MTRQGCIFVAGYCHRDLKPENILLDTENNIKLIDFGLCACPSGGLGVTLDTCCGSPAYAAPELVSGNTYRGNEADVWSLGTAAVLLSSLQPISVCLFPGVLLYALLCGFLPFEDTNVGKLYCKIKSGVYESPEWLSTEACRVIKRCLTTNPAERVTIEQLMQDPWVCAGAVGPIVYWSSYSKYEFDEIVVGHMAQFFNVSRRDVKLKLSEWNYDSFVGIYQVSHHLYFLLKSCGLMVFVILGASEEETAGRDSGRSVEEGEIGLEQDFNERASFSLLWSLSIHLWPHGKLSPDRRSFRACSGRN